MDISSFFRNKLLFLPLLGFSGQLQSVGVQAPQVVLVAVEGQPNPFFLRGHRFFVRQRDFCTILSFVLLEPGKKNA